jgi:hypothetical protein
VSMTETRLGICLLSACDHEECGPFANPLLEQLSSGKYDRMSVLEIPRSVEDWRDQHKTARKRADRAYRRDYSAVNLNTVGGPEWDAINQSAPERQGRPMTAGYLNPVAFSKLPDFPCPVHATRVSGIYNQDGLVAYLVMHRSGDLALVSQILGHDAHLDDEVMYLLFQYALSRETHTPGLVVYNRHDSGTDGLRWFKERLGFEEREVVWLP